MPPVSAETLGNALLAVDTPTPRVRLSAAGASLAAPFDVTGFASASIGAACAELAALADPGSADDVIIDSVLASRWFDMTIRPRGWEMPPIWDAIAGLYRCRDRWIRLHTNAPPHRQAALTVLACAPVRDAVATAVAAWPAEELETAVLAAGGCAAALRSIDEWKTHPQGIAVNQEPLILWEARSPTSSMRTFSGPADTAPLAALRILDCTRVLAGPVCTRMLAGYGATVLRIDPPGFVEANVEPEVTLGKQLAALDLRTAEGLTAFKRLLAGADVFVHGYRPGALDALGIGAAQRREVNPDLIEVGLCAYGWSGPWAQRRGYDSLVQMSSGIAHEGMVRGDGRTPTPLPVQALDHATGYLMAAATLRALRIRGESGHTCSARLSLARTARELIGTLGVESGHAMPQETPACLVEAVEHTSWGPARRLRFPIVRGCPLPHWNLPARRLRSDPPAW